MKGNESNEWNACLRSSLLYSVMARAVLPRTATRRSPRGRRASNVSNLSQVLLVAAPSHRSFLSSAYATLSVTVSTVTIVVITVMRQGNAFIINAQGRFENLTSIPAAYKFDAIRTPFCL